MEKLTVLVDDLRSFRSLPGGEVKIFRTSLSAVDWLRGQDFHSLHIDELWLDHDLGLVNGQVDTVWPFVEVLEEAFYVGESQISIGVVYVHSMNSVEVPKILKTLANLGYNSRRVDANQFLISE